MRTETVHKIRKIYLSLAIGVAIFVGLNFFNVMQVSVPTAYLRILPPELEKKDIWRPSRNPPEEERFFQQWEWMVNFTKSRYFRTIRKKKRIFITGGFVRPEFKTNLTHNTPCFKGRAMRNLFRYCEIVKDDGHSKVDLETFDAVMIYRDHAPTGLEPFVPPGVVTAFVIAEPPWILWNGDFRINNPVLLSYWRGSDIFLPYYKWLPRDKYYEYLGLFPEPVPDKFNYASGKTKMVAMVVSDCKGPNNRLEYAKELQKHVEVDIYGKCGTEQCMPGLNCFKNLSVDYKFYLAFENSNCRDYITEKFFVNGLRNNWIPIVMGAHPDDYKTASPPNSYISVDDFDSPQDLAEYLKLLDKNDELYNSYFRWKGKGGFMFTRDEAFCKLCGYLHYLDANPGRETWGEKAYHFSQILPCLKESEHHWIRPPQSQFGRERQGK